MQWLKSKIDRVRRGETTSLDLTGSHVLGTTVYGLTDLPAEILTLENLTELILAENSIKAIPPAIVNLRNLEKLSLARNRGVRLPSNLVEMTSLQTLDLSGSLTDGQRPPIPPSVKSLDLSGNSPSIFRNADHIARMCQRLRKLNVFGGEVDLRKLHAAAPELTSLGIRYRSSESEAEHLRALESWEHLVTLGLDCDAAGVGQIVTLRNLEELNLFLQHESDQDAWFEKNPDFWLELSSLEALSIVGFPFGATGPHRHITLINVPERLNTLVLHGGLRPIGFPEVLRVMKKLKNLALHESGLKEFPTQALDLPHLEQLTLFGQHIKTLPPDIKRLSNLKFLNLARNPIDYLPPEVGTLAHLETLVLYGAYLKSLPREFAQLRTLKHLVLDNNPLRIWPGEILPLDCLTSLCLAMTSIEVIPREIDRLRNLEYLDITQNRIQEIPRTISNLVNLRYLAVDSKEITEPPAEIVARGAIAIQEYFLALSDASVRLREAKLIIVGEGAVGKTSLAHKLVDPKFDMEKEQATVESTRGISIRDWWWNTSDRQPFKVNIWDFGGQEIYHATHQFFLTHRSLYVLVWDARKEDRLSGFDYWLSIVRLLSGSSPVIIVLNKADERIKEIDQYSLSEKFPNIVSFHKVSVLHGLGMADLTHEIHQALLKLPHVGNLWPARWNAVRKTLEVDAREYIDHEEYLSICAREEIAEEQALVLSQYLHDLGVILHFQDDPLLQRIVVLKPEWGTDAVYAVLDIQSVQCNRGRFSTTDLRTIWSRTRHPVSRHPELLQLMTRFELCFRLGATSNFVAPELLGEQAPSYEWDSTDNLRFEYRYDFMPAGILTRLIARTHSAIDGDYYWKNGLILSISGARAAVIAEPLNRKIRIAVSGHAAKDALAVIRHEMAQIHKTLNEPDMSEMIPCSCAECRSGEPFFYPYKLLLRYYSKGTLSIVCGQSIQEVPVGALLSGIFPPKEMERSFAKWPDRESQVLPTVVINNVIEGTSKPSRNTSEPDSPRSLWSSGGFYLALLLIVIGALGAVTHLFGASVMVVLVMGTMLMTTIVGAFQLKQDDRLSDKSFLSLMTLAFRQLPVLSKFNNGSVTNKPPQE